MSELTYSVNEFEGPLDLLLHLIEREKIDIRDIFISNITEQYLAAVKELDMDGASEFLQMAATLIYIKSRALLPKDESKDEESPEVIEQELERRLIEHKLLKERADNMRLSEAESLAQYSKLPEELPANDPTNVILTNLTPAGLTKAWLAIMDRARDKARKIGDTRGYLAPSLRRDRFTIEECAKRIIVSLAQGPVYFGDIIGDDPTRGEIAAAFIALLDLIRKTAVRAMQNCIYGDIWIETI